MAYQDVCAKIKYPAKTSARFKRLDGYDRLRDGTLYEHLKIPFEQEYQAGGDTYIPMRERRPSIVWRGAQMLASQLAGLLWGDEQMPVVRTYLGEKPSAEDKQAETAIQHLSESLGLDVVMENVTQLASSGSCAVIVRATSSKQPYIEVVPGKECRPKFDPSDPMRMVEFEQLYPTTGNALVEMGYDIDPKELNDEFWFRLTIDNTEEVRYLPMPAKKYERLGEKDEYGVRIAWTRDEKNSFPHGWNCVPVVWVKSPSRGVNSLDGDCLYGAIVDILVAIDYDLSQIERGFRYTADPMLAIRRGELKQGSVPTSLGSEDKTRTDEQGNIVKSPSNVIDIEPGGEAKLLEISGQGLDKFREFARMMREWGLEIAGGMKADASDTKGGDSGRVLEILYQNMVLLLKRWRVALGSNGYVPVLKLLLRGIANDVIAVEGVVNAPADTTLRLVWQTWMTPAGADLNQTVQAWQLLAGGSQKDPVAILPRSMVARMAAGNLGITDTSSVVAELDKQQKQDDADAQAEMEAELNTPSPGGSKETT